MRTKVIYIKDKNVTHLPEHKRAAHLGRVFQDPMVGTAAQMTIAENLSLALHRGEKRGLGKAITETEKASTTEVPNEIIDSPQAMTESQLASSNITDNEMPLHQILFICAGVMLVLGIISGIICISISRKENT